MARVIEENDNRRVNEIRACPACKKATPIRYQTVFVCTGCRLVFEAE
jgi:ribosomal protein L37AE/L43A